MNSPLGDFLCPPGYAPLPVAALAREGSVVLEGARYVRRAGADRLNRATLPYAGHHRKQAIDPVMLIPGFLAGDATLTLMSKALRQQGFRTYRSQIHSNVGCTQITGERIERHLEAIVNKRGRKVTLVGHSLGGMLARGIAARRPDLVDAIVTMGSPMRAPGSANVFLGWNVEMLTRLTKAGWGGMMSEDCTAGACARQSWEDSHQELSAQIAFTAIYSRRDGICDWRACIDPVATAVEVPTSHCGMAFAPIVIDEVLRALRDGQVSRAIRSEAPSAAVSLPRAVHR